MKTEQLVNEAKQRFKHTESKLYLQEKYNSLLHFSSQNGNWTASIDLISFLRTCPNNVIIMDNFKNPIYVDSKSLLKEMENLYNIVMNEYLNEFKKLETKR